VFSILHPCFPGGGEISGSWPAGGSYRDEGWWRAEAARHPVYLVVRCGLTAR
jgi:hypothetical protein